MKQGASCHDAISLALRKMIANDVAGDTFRTLALGLDRNLPRSLSAIPPASPLGTVLDEFRRKTPIAEELPLFAFIACAAQYLAEAGVYVEIPYGRADMDLFTVVLAGSGELKSFATRRIVDSISDLWTPRMLKEPGSSRGLLDEMVAHDGKPVLWACDEWGKFWERTKSETGPHAETPRMLLKFYDKDGYAKRLKTELVEVKRPFLSIFGTSVVDGIHRQLRPDDWESGLVQRFGFVIARPPTDPARDWRRREARWLPVDQKRLKRAWAQMTRNRSALKDLGWTMTSKANRAYGDLWEDLAAQGLGQQFVRRIAFRSIAYAAVYHFVCGKKNGLIDAEDVEWAGKLAMFHLADLKILLGMEAAGELDRLLVAGELLRRKRGAAFRPRDLKMRFKGSLKGPEETKGLYLVILRNAMRAGALDLPSDEVVFDLTGQHLDPRDVDEMFTSGANMPSSGE